MFSPTRTALYVAICAMGLAATEASAGCKIISGTKVCAAWITGSEICSVAIDSAAAGIGTSGLTATCSVRGAGISSEPPPDFFCDDSQLTGAQTCEGSTDAAALAGVNTSSSSSNGWHGTNPARQGPKCNHDKFDPNKNPQCVTGSPDLSGTLQSPIDFPLTCDKKGICTGTAEVGVPDGSFCSNGQDLVDFTADQFIGIVEFDGPEGGVVLFQHCTLDNGGHNYTCTDITNDVDQASCGFGD
jgi:hypothetical protein